MSAYVGVDGELRPCRKAIDEVLVKLGACRMASDDNLWFNQDPPPTPCHTLALPALRQRRALV